MRIDISDLLGRPGATRDVSSTLRRDEFTLPVGEWGPGDEALRGEIDLDLTFEMLVDGLFVQGTVAFGTSVPCGRCLTDVVADHATEVSEMYLDPRKVEAGDEVDAGYEIDTAEGEIDIEPLVRDTLLAALPVRVLCREDCAGLCPVCGTDLNAEDCGHEIEEDPDPRWAALQGLDLPAERDV